MDQPRAMEWKKSETFSLVWTIRRKLFAGFSAMILIAVVSGITIWSQLQSVSEIADALNSLNPMAKNTRYLAHDLNAYMLGHQEHRQEFDQHAKGFNEHWREFIIHQTDHGVPEDVQSIMDEIQTLSDSYFVNSEVLFETYDKQKLIRARLTQNVNQTLKALNIIVEGHSQQFSSHEPIPNSESIGSDDAFSDYAIVSDLRFALQTLVGEIQTYLLGDAVSIDTINQRLVDYQRSIELYLAHIAEETYMTNNFRSQIDIIKSNSLQIDDDVLSLIKLGEFLDDRWQEVGATGDNLDDRVSKLVKIHNDEIESTLVESDEFAIIVIVSAILVGLGAAIVISNMITHPIILLISAVRDFGEGKSSYRLKLRSNDEIGELGLAFNQMADDISNYQNEIENVQSDLLHNERMAVLGTLISTIIHEIRNPLSTVRTAIYSIAQRLDGQNSGLQKTLDRAERSINRCDTIIEELLDYTRTPKLEMKKTVVDDWVKKVLGDQTIDPLINLTVQLNAGTTAQLDQMHFQSCLLNVVNNACQSMIESEEHGQACNLTVTTSSSDDEILIRVMDSGPGISPENLEKIFEPMFSTCAFGVGLGLPSVKKVIERHRGRVEIDSQLGEGTTVSLWLPIDKSEEN